MSFYENDMENFNHFAAHEGIKVALITITIKIIDEKV